MEFMEKTAKGGHGTQRPWDTGHGTGHSKGAMTEVHGTQVTEQTTVRGP